MDRPDNPQDEQPGTSAVPALIHDYRAQRDAWREQARNLSRMREEVLSAADREARDIVSAARTDVRRILLKARRDLLVLAAQVRAAGRLGESEDTRDTGTFLPADDLGHARDVLTSARHDVRRVLDESRPELEGLAAEGEALRVALRGQRPASLEMPKPVAQRRLEEAQAYRPAPVAVEAQFVPVTDEPDDDIPADGFRSRIRTMTAAAAALGALAVIGTVSWLYLPGATTKAEVADARVAAPPSAKSSDPTKKVPATPAASATVAGRAGASVPTGSSLSLNVSATRTAWIRITADGRIAAERLFKAGETHEVRGAREVSVRAGDAGAVTVSVAGGRAAVLGREGEVVTRRFGVEAARVQPPPAPAATPSREVATKPSSPAPARPQPATAVATTQRPEVTAAPAPRITPQPQPQLQPQPVVTAPPPPAAPPITQALSAPATRPSATPADRPSSPPVPAAPATAPVSLQDTLTSTATRWLDAYYRQDRASMNAISGAQVNVADDRVEKERLPRGAGAVQRSLEDVRLNVVGTDAILTARMTERMEDASAGRMAQVVSFVSHMWSQRNGVWQLHDVRIVSASALNRAAQR